MLHIKRIQWFILLTLLQALVLNHVHIGPYATPFLYIYFILKFNSGTDIKPLLLWSFFLGFTIDMLGNTPGLNASASVLTAFCRPRLLRILSTRDISENFEPGIRVMGAGPFFRYATAMTLIHTAMLNTIDFFSFVNPGTLAVKILTDTLITLVCVLCIDSVRRDK